MGIKRKIIIVLVFVLMILTMIDLSYSAITIGQPCAADAVFDVSNEVLLKLIGFGTANPCSPNENYFFRVVSYDKDKRQIGSWQSFVSGSSSYQAPLDCLTRGICITSNEMCFFSDMGYGTLPENYGYRVYLFAALHMGPYEILFCSRKLGSLVEYKKPLGCTDAVRCYSTGCTPAFLNDLDVPFDVFCADTWEGKNYKYQGRGGSLRKGFLKKAKKYIGGGGYEVRP